MDNIKNDGYYVEKIREDLRVIVQRMSEVNNEEFCENSMLQDSLMFGLTLMNDAVYHFKRYEDASLEYTGINKHSSDENVGLFSTIITKEEYEHMDKLQNASMAAKARRAEAREKKAAGKSSGKANKAVNTSPADSFAASLNARIQPMKAAEAPAVSSELVRSAADELVSSGPIVDPAIVIPGLRVSHIKFGVGTVKNKTDKDPTGNYQVEVVFDKGGTKLLRAPLVFEKGLLSVVEE